MAKNNYKRICTICGREYEYCTRGCKKFSNMEPWHDAYDVKNCKELYNVTAGYINHWLEPEVEAARLQKLDLSYKDMLPKWMQDAIKELQGIDTTNANAINQALEVEIEPKHEVPVEEQDEKKSPEEITEKKDSEDVKATAPKFNFNEIRADKKMNNQNKYKPNKYGK